MQFNSKNGFFLIKAIEIEESPNKYGVKKIRYWAKHREITFGMFTNGTLIDEEFASAMARLENRNDRYVFYVQLQV